MQKPCYRIYLTGFSLVAFLLAACAPSTSGNAGSSAPPQSTAPAIAPAQPEAAPVSVAAPEPSPHEQRVSRLIEQVEQAYTQGQTAYRKGDLASAKAAFDRAVDLMLSSGMDIKADAQLESEFDHIVDGVNALEMEALKQGNGFSPKEEPAPAEAAEEATFVVDPNIVAKAKADLATTKSDLPLVVNDYVASSINFFANTKKGHNTLLHSFQRSGRYRAMIQRVMAEEGVPQDLIYLAVAESGFNPRAMNPHSHAGGMWQFMPHDPAYGLAFNSYVDERFDPEKSTRAYARYMKFIYNQLGDWYLAMAAYDHGTGNIQHAVQRTGYADFWELYKRHELPAETQNYVPEILAAIIIANNPTQYGFDDISLDPPVLTDTVTINYSIDLRLVADLVGAPVDELEALNPSLLRMVTPPDQPFDLHLPAGTATLYAQRVGTVPESRRAAWRYHRVAPDDTLASIARQFHITDEELADANQLNEDASLQGVEALAIPQAPVAAPTHMLLYVARKGDTLVTIADRFGVSLTDLRRWNKISGVKVEPGRRLRIAGPSTPAHRTRSRHRGESAASGEGTPKGAPEKGSAHRPAGTATKRAAAPQASKAVPAARGKTATKAHAGPTSGNSTSASANRSHKGKKSTAQK